MVKWLNVTIDQVAHIEMGQSPSSVGYNAVGDGVPLIQGNADIINGKTVKRVWTSLITKTCEKSDIILTVRAPVGSVAYATEKACIGRGVCAIRPERIVRSFLFQYLLQFQSKWRRLEQGSTFTAINHKDVASFVLTIPESIEEQQEIAEILATCDEVIESTERLIEKYQAIKTGMLKDLMTRGIGEDGRLRPRPDEFPLLYKDSCLGPIPRGWTVKRLEQLGTIYSGSTPSTADETYWGGNIPFVTPNDMSRTSHAFLGKTSRSITEKGLTKTRLIPGGNLVVSTRAPIGYLNLILSDFTTNQGCKSIVFNDQQDPLFHYYNMHMYVKTMINYGVGTTFAEISKNDISKLRISLPDTIKEQQKIATVLDGVDKKIQAEQKLLAKYRQIKQGLLKQLLTPCNGVSSNV